MKTTGQIKTIKQNATNKAWSILLSDGVWYGAGFDRPAGEVGDTVEFDVTANGKYMNVTKGTMVKLSPATGAPKAEPTSTAAAPASVKSRESYWEDKADNDHKIQREIRLQASRNQAINFVDLLIKNNALPLGATKKNAAPVIEEAVRHYTHLFYGETEQVYSNGIDVSGKTDVNYNNNDNGDTDGNDYEG